VDHRTAGTRYPVPGLTVVAAALVRCCREGEMLRSGVQLGHAGRTEASPRMANSRAANHRNGTLDGTGLEGAGPMGAVMVGSKQDRVLTRLNCRAG